MTYRRTFPAAVSVKVFVALLSLGSCVWAYLAIPVFSSSMLAQSLVPRILANEHFRLSALRSTLERIEGHPPSFLVQPEMVRGRALIQLRVAQETLLKQDSRDQDGEAKSADESITEVLSLLPTDSFFWLKFYSAQVSKSGFDALSLKYLEQSYLLGPFEGWISLSRNRLSLAVFPILSETMRDTVVSEFAAIVEADLIDDASDILAGIGWSNRQPLLTGLQQVDLDARKALAKRLRDVGMRVEIPGVDGDERPWR